MSKPDYMENLTRIVEENNKTLTKIEVDLHHITKNGNKTAEVVERLQEIIMDIKSDNKTVYNEMFGTSLKRGHTHRLEYLEGTVANWISQGKMIKFMVTIPGLSGLVLGVINWLHRI